MRHTVLVAAICLAAAACAKREAPVVEAPPQQPSAIEPGLLRTSDDAKVLATSLAGMLPSKVPAGSLSGPIRIEPAQGEDPIAPALADTLRTAGYAAEVGPGVGPALTYRVGKLDRGIVARLTIGGHVHAVRAFDRVGNSLRPSVGGSVMRLGGGA